MRESDAEWRAKLIKRAKKLAEAGYSPIPVHGDNAPTEPKKPAVSWRAYQSRIARKGEIERGFRGKAAALGIVCGRVSQLLVIDFDDVLRYQQFCRHLPQYSETYTVKTRRGFHLYFRTGEKVASHQFDGGDIKAERSYVVAPPSQIGGFVYRCVKNVAQQDLARTDIDQLLNYFHVNAGSNAVAGKPVKSVEDVDLKGLYGRLAPRMGRNNALYRVASMAREAGLAKVAAESRFLELHATAPGRPGHKPETVEERYGEGLRTIASAYAGGSRSVTARRGLPNSARERLLSAQRSTVVARLLDCFVMAGWAPEAYFTLRQAVALGRRYGLNRKSVLQALTGDHSSFNGRHIISRRYVEYLDMRGLNGRKRGRPVELAFQTPSIGRLLSVLGVGRSPCDPMRIEDVKTAKAYRMAVHREYIKRLAPRSSLPVLAGRLGVSERTIRRYNRALEVRVSACVGFLKLTRDSVSSLPKRGWRRRKNTTNGFWLEAGDGLRLPAWRHIGAKLLKAGDSAARICMRRASVYRMRGDPAPAMIFEAMSLREFVRSLAGRGEVAVARGVMERLSRAVAAARARATAARYERIQLSFDSVDARIADDKVAETISGYLVARDENGNEVRRPARRGIAYRLLKQFGNGNVFLALRSSYREVMSSLADHALRAGDEEVSAKLLARSFA